MVSGTWEMARELEGTTFGDQLRRERERRGVAVETICAATKVPVRHILSLEAGAFRDLPGGVFRRGFVRSYLGVLGLEETPWMARFEESCRQSGVRDPVDANWATFAENVKNTRYAPRRRARSSRVGLVVALFVLAAFTWSAARLFTHRTIVPHPHFAGGLKTWAGKLASR